jgi:peptidoglycan/LPS O-acetylase OafA/YrhL
VNGVIWTLTFEAYFYLLLPFVSRFFCGSAAKVARNACIAALVTIGWAWIRFNVDGISRRLFGIARDRIQELMANLLPTYAVHFALGMAGAYAFLRLRGHLRLTQSR